MENSKTKRWLVAFLIIFVSILSILGAFVAIVDPYFHYHAPLPIAKYELKLERYQNNGIVKHFEYDAIITGSSMTECFKTSELDALFGTNSVKVPFAGSSYKEINDNLEIAIKYNPDIKMIVRGLDMNRFFDDMDTMVYEEYPDYLYDDFVWNDAAYLFNKDVLITALQNVHGYLVDGSQEMSFDSYANWSEYEIYGREAILADYDWESMEVVEKQETITPEEYAKMEANIEQNIVQLAKDNPDIEFYIFFAPYGIYCFDWWNRQGLLEKHILAEKYFIEKLLPYDNIHVFSFLTEYDVICNPDNYKDLAHYSGDVNSMILQWMYEGKHEMTYDNYEEHCRQVWEFYTGYDYDGLYE